MIDEGYTKYQCHWQRTSPLPTEVLTPLIHCRNRLYEVGLVGFYPEAGVGYGNLSMRAPGFEKFVISGTQTGHIPRTDAGHYALVTDYDINANQVSCSGPVQASSEALTHGAIYQLAPTIGAVVHVHSAQLWQAIKHQLPTTAATVPDCTPDMAREFLRLYNETDLPDTRVAVMAGHAEGIVAFGSDVQQATERILALLNGPAGK